MAVYHGYLTALLYLRRRRARPNTYGHGFGVVVAFLNGALLIRFAANIFIMLDLAARRASLGWSSFLAASVSVIAVYGVTILPLSSYRYLHDFLKHTRLRNAPFSRRTKYIGLAGSVFFRPMTGGMFVLAALTVILSASFSTDSVAMALPVAVFVFMVVAGAAVVVAVMQIFQTDRGDCEYLEIGFLITMLSSNFDVRIAGSQAELIFFLTRLPEWPAVIYVIALPGALMILAVALITVIHFMKIIPSGIGHLVDRRQRKRGNRTPFAVAFFFQRSKLWFWILAFAVSIPILTSPAVPPAVKMWSIILFVTLSLAAFVRIAAGFENEVSETLLFRLDRHHRLKLFGPPLLINCILSMVPIIVWAIAL